MDRISSYGSLPGGHWTEGDPTTNQAATEIAGVWLEGVQEEILAVIEAAGITPDVNDNAQLLQALAIVAGGRGGLRNALINGGFRFWQRLAQANQFLFNVSPSSVVETYTADRFFCRSDTLAGSGAGTATVRRNSFSPGQTLVDGNPRYYATWQQTVAATITGPVFGQRIEDVTRFSGVSIAVSFWAKANTPITHTLKVTQDFGQLPSSAPVQVAAAAVNLTTSWQKFVFVIACPSIAGKTVNANTPGTFFDFLEVALVGPTGVTFTVDTTGWQVEEGEGATPYEVRSDAVEYLLCARYYEKSAAVDVGVTDTASLIGCVIHAFSAVQANERNCHNIRARFVVKKRTFGSISWRSTTIGAAAGTIGVNYGAGTTVQTVTGIQGNGSSDTGWPNIGAGAPAFVAGTIISAHWTADAEL